MTSPLPNWSRQKPSRNIARTKTPRNMSGMMCDTYHASGVAMARTRRMPSSTRGRSTTPRARRVSQIRWDTTNPCANTIGQIVRSQCRNQMARP